MFSNEQTHWDCDMCGHRNTATTQCVRCGDFQGVDVIGGPEQHQPHTPRRAAMPAAPQPSNEEAAARPFDPVHSLPTLEDFLLVTPTRPRNSTPRRPATALRGDSASHSHPPPTTPVHPRTSLSSPGSRHAGRHPRHVQGQLTTPGPLSRFPSDLTSFTLGQAAHYGGEIYRPARVYSNATIAQGETSWFSVSAGGVTHSHSETSHAQSSPARRYAEEISPRGQPPAAPYSSPLPPPRPRGPRRSRSRSPIREIDRSRIKGRNEALGGDWARGIEEEFEGPGGTKSLGHRKGERFKACQRCDHYHTKCVRKRGQDRCEECKRHNADCIKRTEIRQNPDPPSRRPRPEDHRDRQRDDDDDEDDHRGRPGRTYNSAHVGGQRYIRAA